ncbi:hypothetical protein QCA50_013334 [Cerrena zonata]|uniref:Uncharacterized protein n=1 Tax=Cerrena zonata TaxID=2478898 RepID=A0AAW0G371_9APHY
MPRKLYILFKRKSNIEHYSRTVLNPTSPPLPDVIDTKPHIKSVGTPVPPVEDDIEHGAYDIPARSCVVEESRLVDDLHIKVSHPQKTSDSGRNEGDSFIAASITESPTNEEATKADRDDGDQKLDEADSEAASTEPDASRSRASVLLVGRRSYLHSSQTNGLFFLSNYTV